MNDALTGRENIRLGGLAAGEERLADLTDTEQAVIAGSSPRRSAMKITT
jgi:hypothetical protein